MQNNKWEAFSDSFEKRNAYVVGKATVDAIKARLYSLRETGAVLELGCGNGTYTECFLGHASSILATDISEKMVSTTREKYHGPGIVRVETADCASLQYPDNSFDTVFMANLFHIIPCRERALKEAKRVLKPNGRLIIVSITQHQMRIYHLLTLIYRYRKTYGKKPAYAIKLTPSNVNFYISQAGFNHPDCVMLGDKVKALYAEATKS